MTDPFAKIIKRQAEHRKAMEKLKAQPELTDLRWMCDCGRKNFNSRLFCAECSQPRPRLS